jgi:hypothetical protein
MDFLTNHMFKDNIRWHINICEKIKDNYKIYCFIIIIVNVRCVVSKVLKPCHLSMHLPKYYVLNNSTNDNFHMHTLTLLHHKLTAKITYHV